MTESWICVRMQLWNCTEYSRILSMPGFWVCKHCTRFWIWLNSVLWQGSEYVWSTFHMILNKLSVLNMLGSEYGNGVNRQGLHRVLNMPKESWICLNNTEYDWICQHTSWIPAYILEFFLLDTLKTTFWIENLMQR